MKERPIIFSSDMVKAILDGRKTQTRRVINPQPKLSWLGYMTDYAGLGAIQCGPDYPDSDKDFVKCPYGQVGDWLWVKETWAEIVWPAKYITYKADEPIPSGDWGKWKSSRFMPKWASRIWQEITGIRVERLQDISEEDAQREGLSWEPSPTRSRGWNISAIKNFADLWDSINKSEGKQWIDNPWCWVISFRLLT